MPKWTKEQQQAIEFRKESLLVAAAAGSGKTAVLVERIVSMITGEAPIDIDRLLVVTFTRAAAAEMRERISLRVTAALEENPQDENLVRQMALLNQANIMTIDSFCKKVMEENFHLVELDPDYQVMDENELNMLITETMEEVLEEEYDGEDPGFLNLADTFGGEKDDEALQGLILKIWRFSRSGTDPKEWIQQAAAMYDLSEVALEDTNWFNYLRREVTEILAESLKLCLDLCTLVATDPALATSKYGEFFAGEYRNILMASESVTGDMNYDQLRNLANGIQFGRLPAVKAEVSDNQPLVRPLRDHYKKMVNKMNSEWLSQDQATVVKLITEMADPMAELGKLTWKFYERLQMKKLEHNRVDFADLEHYALGILRNESGPTEAALKYQARFEEILIDEYQDSNDVQEAILTSVSRDHTNIFMVGDVKQSIYRFRQAKPEIFLGKYRRFTNPESDQPAAGRKILLYRNFRSRPEVLDGVNRVFSAIMSERAGELDYTQDEALIFGAAFDPAEKHPVQIRLVDAAAPLDEQDGEFAELDDLKGIELEAIYVASQIKELVGEGKTRIHDDKTVRNLRYRDIVILLRATTNVAGIFKEALEKAAVPVYSDTGAGYFDSIEIRTIMSLLRIIDNPRQDIPLLAVLRSALFSFTEDELIRIRIKDRRALLLECLELSAQEEPRSVEDQFTNRKIKRFLEQLAIWRQEVIHRPLDEFIWKLYIDTAYLEYAGAMPNGIQRQANLRILFQRAGDYEKTSFKGLYQFIRYIDAMRSKSGDYGDARIMGENEDVVRIMSIHKSKGLEFPIVFLANAGKRFNKMDQGGDLILHEKLGIAVKHKDPIRGTVEETLPRLVVKSRINEESISEEMRVLYVAMTRAKEKLFITGNIKGLTKKMETWFRKGTGIESTGLSPRMILAEGSYLDWIMPVVLNQSLIRGQMENFDESTTTVGDGLAFDIELISRGNLAMAQAEAEEAKIEPFWNGEQLTDERLIAILDYQYPHQRATLLPSKVSVSVIKKRAIEENPEVSGMAAVMDETYEPTTQLPRPQFLKASRELTGADRGTAFHTVMLHIDPFIQTEAEIDQAIKELVAKEIMLPEEAAVVNRRKVLGFFNSTLGERFRQAAKASLLYREEVFVREVQAQKLVPDWTVNDPVTLIGIIDAFFIENDQIILLDYKTDAIPSGQTDFLAKKYQSQIELYADALSAITGKPVTEAYLYSVSKEETIRLL